MDRDRRRVPALGDVLPRAAEKFGGPEYGPGWFVHQLARFLKTFSNSTLTFGAAIYVEEILDTLQREQMADESLQEMVQKVSRIHVIEEARHIRYAREETLRQWPRLGPLGRAYSRMILAVSVYFSTTRLIDPKVYAAAGLDVGEAVAAAAANPHWRQTKQFAAHKVSSSSTRSGSSPDQESCSGAGPECCSGSSEHNRRCHRR